MHMLPVLGALEAELGERPVVVLGVHSAKFKAEAEPGRIRKAMARYGVDHPVVVDEEHRIWQSYTVRAWPTLVFLRPDGTVAATLPGEVPLEILRDIVGQLLKESREKGTLGTRAHIEPESAPQDTGPLAFPGKVEATPAGLAIADSGHHRVVITAGRGQVPIFVGSGEPGLADGPAHEARFKRPQGMTLYQSKLLVADTGNHALRAIDLDTHDVVTLVGDGTIGVTVPQDLAPASRTRLRSPWDLAVVNGVVLIAMSGAHQLWAYLPEEQAVVVFAGSGREGIEDGSFHEASFAQPTGLTAPDGNTVYVADSETSAVRALDFADEQVRTIVGKGLLEFGDRDGDRKTALLQHAQDVAFGPNGLLVADTYNDKLKKLDPVTGTVETWYAVAGEPGLGEPGGLLQLEGGQVVVADTNRHRILVIDPASRDANLLVLGG